MEQVIVGVDFAPDEGSDEWILDLARPIPGEIDDSQFNAGMMKRVQIRPRRVAITGSVEHEAVVGHID